mgnify:CR=1 FL=1
MIEFLQRSKSLKISVFFLICALISYMMSSITALELPAFLLTVFMVCSIFALAFTVYFVFRKVFALNGLISMFAFFATFSGAVYVTNMLFADEYLDLTWRYSLVVGGIVLLVKVFKLFFIDKSEIGIFEPSDTSAQKQSDDKTQN